MTNLTTIELSNAANSGVSALEKEVELYNCGLTLRLTEFNILETETAKKDLQQQIEKIQNVLLIKEKQAVAAMAVGANSLYDDISLLIQRKQELLRTKKSQVRQCDDKQRGAQLLLEHTRLRLRQCQQKLVEMAVVDEQEPVSIADTFAQQVSDRFRKDANGKFVQSVKTALSKVVAIEPEFGYYGLPVPH